MTTQHWPTPTAAPRGGRPKLLRLARCVSAVTVAVLLAAALSGCGCRPGYVGPYGGVHPGRCWVG
jgi:hypothetical protein